MVVVLGSMNMDMTVSVEEIPGAGETLFGSELCYYPGGKGANQAVAAARLGAPVTFLGKVGEDAAGEQLVKALKKSGIDVSHIEVSAGQTTGAAMICVNRQGQNSIVVVPGANYQVDVDYVMRNRATIEQARVLLAQHEVPLEAVKAALQIAKQAGVTTILNPAPCVPLDQEMLALVDILVPNEHELARLVNSKTDTNEGVRQAGKRLLAQGVKHLVVTLGERGVMYLSAQKEQFYPAYRVHPVDTTAAGDSFLGGFVDRYLKCGDIAQAIGAGQQVASYAVQHEGAQSSLPTAEQLKAYLEEGAKVS